MHITESLLPPLQAAAQFVAATLFAVHGTMTVVKRARKDPDSKLLLVAAGASTFALLTVRLPSVTGLSSHPTGTGTEAMLFKPPVLAFFGTIVLLFQAILLAHRNLTALGTNAFSMVIANLWCGCLMWMLFEKVNKMTAVFLTMAATDPSTYVATSFQLAVAYPGTEGNFGTILMKLMSIFALIQIPLTLAEGVPNVFLFSFLTRVVSSELSKLSVFSCKDAGAAL